MGFIQRFLTSSQRQFWALQIAGWSWYAAIVYITVVFPKDNLDKSTMYLHLFLETLSGFLLSLFLRYLYVALRKSRPIIRFLVASAGVAVAAWLWTLLKYVAYFYLHFNVLNFPDWLQFGGWYINSFSSLLTWVAVFYGLTYYQGMKNERERALKLESETKEAQLKMLRFQLHPHFMFNCMNTLSTLVMLKDVAAAQKMITGLSGFLRYSLDSEPTQKVTLTQEIDALQKYVDIERLRFADRLNVEIDLNVSVKTALVPSLFLQPIIENAIKYAIANREEGGKIHLSACLTESTSKDGNVIQRLKIVVADDGPGIQDLNLQMSDERGVGLQNTIARLNGFYGEDYSIDFDNVQPAGLAITIILPLEYFD